MYNDKTLKSVAEAVKQVMEAELSAKQKAIAKIEHPKHKIDAGDLAALRAGKKPVKEESHQAKTTMKHVKNATAGEKKAAKDIKPGVAGYRDRIAMLHSAAARGGLKKEEVEGVAEEASQEEFTAEIKKAQAKSQGKEKVDVAKPEVVAVKQESVEQVNEKAKWRSSSAAEPHPMHDPDVAAHDRTATTSPIRSKADKPLPYGSIQSRRGAEVASSGPRKGMVTKKSAESLKNRIKVNLNKEEVEQIDERTLSEPETAEKERLVKSMKKNLAGFKERYGERAKSVMYATATARAKENK
jgi:hypothetical protein